MKLAGCMVVQNHQPRFGTFKCLKSLSDFTTVLEDNCMPSSYLKHFADEHMTLFRGGRWNDTANRTMLMYRAYVAGCDYVLPWSADVLPSAKLFQWIVNARNDRQWAFGPRYDMFQCELRELWDSQNNWRSDGVWIQKRNVFMQRNWIGDDDISMPKPHYRLHIYPFTRNRRKCTHHMPPGFCIYHFGSLTADMRRQRVEKYAIEDANHEFQADYKYLADETGLQLTPVPPEDVEFFKQWTNL